MRLDSHSTVTKFFNALTALCLFMLITGGLTLLACLWQSVNLARYRRIPKPRTKEVPMITRDATADDVPQMSAFLMRLMEMGKRTNGSDPAFVLDRYINAADNIKTTLAEDNGAVLGFQSLKRATEGNIYGVTPGWGIVGTHVNPDAARRGVGRALFPVTLQAAKTAGLHKIDASIGVGNAEGQAYYEAMGFRTYRTPDGLVCKCYTLS